MIHFTDSNNDKLKQLHSQEAEELAKILATKYDIPYIDLSTFAINTDALKIIPEPEARAANIAGFKLLGRKLFLATIAPQNPKVQLLLNSLAEQQYQPQLHLCSEASLARAWEHYQEISHSIKTEGGLIDISNEEISRLLTQVTGLVELKRLLVQEGQTALKEGGISSVLEIILAGGIATSASDIHIEPQEAEVRMRYRLDGVLQDINFFDHKLYQRLLSRIKLVSGLKLNVKKSAQDGRFTIKVQDNEIEVRTSILPGAYGESIVLRLLNPKTLDITLENLGVAPYLLTIMEREIAKPNGLVLLTGPTGSGKTTTLYAFLKQVNTTGNKIITIEDPIEYHLTGVNQTQVDAAKDYTFLSGLRAALRQDPDIIMVGEIRDSETAEIAINSSLTGHLVFSTLHTNNAAGTIPRLVDLGVNPKVIEAALNIAIAQRLIRKLCPTCRQEYTPTTEELNLVNSIRELTNKKRPEFNLSVVATLWKAGPGCDECHHTGYRGRLGVFEAIAVTPQVTEILDRNPSEREIRQAASAQGMLNLREDGTAKVIQGLSSWEELARVVDVYEDEG
jgi:type II secretory ATPase GspE/PulE/Tfp pilus assembly ATPase PilB-like protein